MGIHVILVYHLSYVSTSKQYIHLEASIFIVSEVLHKLRSNTLTLCICASIWISCSQTLNIYPKGLHTTHFRFKSSLLSCMYKLRIISITCFPLFQITISSHLQLIWFESIDGWSNSFWHMDWDSNYAFLIHKRLSSMYFYWFSGSDWEIFKHPIIVHGVVKFCWDQGLLYWLHCKQSEHTSIDHPSSRAASFLPNKNYINFFSLFALKSQNI